MKRYRAFTLVEIIIAIMLMGILAGTMTLSGSKARQTAQKEAEKVAALLKSATQRADLVKVGFTLKVENNSIDISWDGTYKPHDLITPLEASKGCSFGPDTTYEHKKKDYSFYISIEDSENKIPENKIYHQIKVTGADNKTLYVVISSGDIS